MIERPPHPQGALWQLVNTWLSTRKDSNIFLKARQDGAFDIIIAHKHFDKTFGIIGDSWAILNPGKQVDAADPRFFEEFEKAIEHEKRWLR